MEKNQRDLKFRRKNKKGPQIQAPHRSCTRETKTKKKSSMSCYERC